MISTDEILRNLPALFTALFTAILFIQSGLDKAFDWSGNLSFLKDHFSKIPFSGVVPMMLGTLTILEIATGALAAAGIIYFLATGSLAIIFYSAVLGTAAITALFFGQRIAKDYPGAAVLVPYFILLTILMILTNPHVIR